MRADKHVEIYDTTLRDGSQGEGISFSVQDKLLITRKLDEKGFAFIEGGWPGANPKDIAFFEQARKLRLKTAELVAFGSTRRAHTKAAEDMVLKGLVAARTGSITIFGKSWDMHVREVFRIELDENIRMIEDSVRYLRSKGRRVIFDAEHFFDGYKANPGYALKAIGTAYEAGARTIVLCDTNGGSLPTEVRRITQEVARQLRCPLGIHAHNDSALAVANSLAAVEGGATHVQGTVNGLGERCGNADLVPIIANLELKMERRCLPAGKLKEMTDLSRYVYEVCNLPSAKNQPYTGQSAFAHKGGVHINAVMKRPETYEHVTPSKVGNRRRFLVSELGGKTNVMLKAQELSIKFDKESPEARRILQAVQERENQGYQYEAAEASFELLIREVTGRRKRHFEFEKVEVSAENIGDKDSSSTAIVVLKVGKKKGVGVATGDGPVNALDKALREALEPFYPIVSRVQLEDYKVRVVDSKEGTAAKVRVFIEFSDGREVWTTVGVSGNIIEASWQALVDSIEYRLTR
ncbi:MAG: (R)-citramalate synthase [Candidatus Omnitrophica bacterium]|nr:(R)-citramalate synthase [Candidatus Omnitrophota bacterium]